MPLDGFGRGKSQSEIRMMTGGTPSRLRTPPLFFHPGVVDEDRSMTQDPIFPGGTLVPEIFGHFFLCENIP